MPNSKNSLFNSPLFSALLLVLGLICLAYAGVHAWDWHSHTQGTAQPPKSDQTVTISANKPDEKPITSGIDHSMPADQPRQITIDSIGVQALIQRVDKDRSGTVAAPSNVHFAGWYINSVKPGGPGLSIIDGHVSGRYSPGIFNKLSYLKNGASIAIEFGDGSSRAFEVVDRQELAAKSTSAFLFKKRPDIESQLNLVTCGGGFNKGSSSYDKRVVIVAKRVS